MKVKLESILSQTDLEAPPKSLFSDVYSRVCKSLDLREKWYFGLCYSPPQTPDLVWLDNSRKPLKKLSFATKQLQFRIKYYPEDVASELIESITIQIFYLEMKKAILNGDIFCPADTCALLASYSLQVELGNFNEDRLNTYLVTHNNYLPYRIMRQYYVDPTVWTKSISDMWKNLSGMDPENAMLEYLKLVQNLDMYGITYFNIINKKKTRLLLGVNALGMNIYTPNDKLSPQLSFSWSEIKKLKFKGKKFIIQFMGKKIPNFVFHTLNGRKSKQIYNLGLGNHELYLKRRKPDSPEVVVLKEKAKALKALREKNKEKINLEISFQEDILHRKGQYHNHLQKLQDDLQSAIQTIQQEIAAKMEETKKLQEQIEKARKDEEEYRVRQQMSELARLRQRAKITEEGREFENSFNESNQSLPELVKVDGKLNEHLMSLQEKLRKSIRDEEETLMDRLHRHNVMEQRDKYKTLSDIRGVDCARRIKMFDRL